jgi:predicted transcriptional regulator
MMDKGIRRLLVVEKGEVVGIVTQKDVMRGTLDTFMALSMVS